LIYPHFFVILQKEVSSQSTENFLLVGINYDKKTKTHTCIIEKE